MASALSRYFKLITLLWAAALLIAACEGEQNVAPRPTPDAFHAYENEAAFNLIYPNTWSFRLVQEGVILFGEPDKLTLDESEPAPNLAILREPNSRPFGVEEDFNHFLANGPLAAGFLQPKASQEFLISGQPAFRAVVTADEAQADEEGYVDVTSLLVVVRSAETDATYRIVFTAPSPLWSDWLPVFEIILASFEFNE